MKRFVIMAAALASILAAKASAAVATVGVYDEGTYATNSVDFSGTALTVGTFATDVANAYAADAGGVWNLEPAYTQAGTVDLTYGVSQSKTLTITMSTGQFQRYSDSTNQKPISGSLGYATGSYLAFSSADWTWTFSEPLSEIGLTVLERDGTRTFGLSAKLDDDSVVPIATNYTIAGVSPFGSKDTFFGYEAPAGRSIVSLTKSGGAFLRMDDIGFVTVPEPTSIGILALAALGLMHRRRA